MKGIIYLLIYLLRVAYQCGLLSFIWYFTITEDDEHLHEHPE